MPVPLYPLSDWMDNVALAGLCSKETLWATYELACSVIRRGIPGDLVECGVYGGANSAVMARAIMEPTHYWDENRQHAQIFGSPWPPRRVHCFDTFAGIPQAGPEDHEFLSAGHEPGLSTCDLESCKAHMVEWSLPLELFFWHEGDFAETVPKAAISDLEIQSIALLRLDGDLYRSTKVCMEHLYPLVSSGGWVIVDDWSLSGARKAVEEFVVPSPIYFQRQK